MKRTFFFAAALAALAMTGCNNETEEVKAEYITVSTSIENLTRVSTTGNTAKFDEGDKISVYAWTGSANEVNTAGLVVNNSVNTLAGGKWTSAPLMKWVDMTTPHFFLAVYPHHAISNFKADSVTLDPSKQMESDLMAAINTGESKLGLKATNNPVSLKFDHMMSKLAVALEFRTEFDGVPTVTSVSTVAKSKAGVDYLQGTVTPAGTAGTFALAAVTANKEFASVIVPQAVQRIVVTINGKNYVYNHPTPLTLEKGKKQTVKLIVGRNRIELDQVIINDWGTATDITGGEALD